MDEAATDQRRGIVDLPILDALRQSGCALCTVAAESSERFLRNLFHEYVNDPHMHHRLHASWGFCPTHTRAAVIEAQREGDLLGFAILAESIVGFIASRVHAANIHPKSHGRRSRQRTIEGRCPACEAGHGSASFALHRLPEFMQYEEFAQWRRAGGRLCSQHLRQATGLAEHCAAMQTLLDQERQLLEGLVRSLGEYVRKCDWQYRHEPKADEQQSPAAAASFFEGDIYEFPDIFRDR
jgi:hypothetical protein